MRTRGGSGGRGRGRGLAQPRRTSGEDVGLVEDGDGEPHRRETMKEARAESKVGDASGRRGRGVVAAGVGC